MRVRTGLLVVLGFMLPAAPARAQGAYVSVSMFGDVARSSQSGGGGYLDCLASGITTAMSGNSESLGFGLRVGTPIAATWGVEAEFTRSGETGGSFTSVRLTTMSGGLLIRPAVGVGWTF